MSEARVFSEMIVNALVPEKTSICSKVHGEVRIILEYLVQPANSTSKHKLNLKYIELKFPKVCGFIYREMSTVHCPTYVITGCQYFLVF